MSATTVPTVATVRQPDGPADATAFGAVVRRETTAAAALPVVIDVCGAVAEAVRRLVEGELGWQPVDDATAPLIPPVVRLADVTATGGPGRLPTVLLVASDVAPVAAADAVRRLRPATVVAWPTAHEDLRAAVGRATATPLSRVATVPVVRLGGAGGGVGTTTVALALAGLAGWTGRRTLVVSDDRTLLPPGAPTIAPDALSAPDLWARAAPLAGVPGSRAVRTRPPTEGAEVADPAIEVVICDLGVADDADVLVCRPDAAGLAALDRAVAGSVVVVGHGPVPAHHLAAAVGARRRIDLPAAARVGRAAVVGRVPAALPGRFVRALGPLLPDPGST